MMVEGQGSSGTLWTGRIMSGFVSLFLLVDGGGRLAGFAPYVEGMTRFGYPADLAPWVGLTLLICAVLYVLPRTAILGAILVTGYLGGATATRGPRRDGLGRALATLRRSARMDPRGEAMSPFIRAARSRSVASHVVTADGHTLALASQRAARGKAELW
jgi:DoxX-like protein